MKMVNRCCVIHCKSGHRKSNEKVPLFKSPNDPELFKKWELALVTSEITFKKSSHVCAKHFHKQDLNDEKIIKDNSGTIYYHQTLSRIKLKPGAVPAIFLTKESNESTSEILQNNESEQICQLI